MGFWSRIGLADKSEILELQSAINTLNEENKALQEQNHRLLERIEESSGKNLDIIVNEISNIRKHTESVFSNTDKQISELSSKLLDLQEKSEKIGMKINTQTEQYMQLFKENKGSINQFFNEIQEVIKANNKVLGENLEKNKTLILEKLQINSELSINEKNEMLSEISNCKEEITEVLFKVCGQMSDSYQHILINELSKVLEQKADGIAELQENLSSLGESMKYLWTIMKAVWVDSVLNDIDSFKA